MQGVGRVGMFGVLWEQEWEPSSNSSGVQASDFVSGLTSTL